MHTFQRLFCAMLCCCAWIISWGQTTANFENISIPAAGFIDNAGASGVFSSGNTSLHNYYDNQFFYWEGWAISKVTDNQTPGFGNQYSAITGTGANNTAQYAIGYSYNGNYIRLDGAAKGGVVNGIYVTNNTYAWYSMKDGDAFAKKFGGITGNDPDFFKLTIKKHLNGQPGSDSIEVYLADYRAANSADDYILNTWKYVDLRPLGNVDSLVFYLSSSDNGLFGMNTPAYFCVDEVVTADMVTSTTDVPAAETATIFPNPAKDQFFVQYSGDLKAPARVTDAWGRTVWQGEAQEARQGIQCRHWPTGVYFVQMANQTTRLLHLYTERR